MKFNWFFMSLAKSASIKFSSGPMNFYYFYFWVILRPICRIRVSCMLCLLDRNKVTSFSIFCLSLRYYSFSCSRSRLFKPTILIKSGSLNNFLCNSSSTLYFASSWRYYFSVKTMSTLSVFTSGITKFNVFWVIFC